MHRRRNWGGQALMVAGGVVIGTVMAILAVTFVWPTLAGITAYRAWVGHGQPRVAPMARPH